MSELAGGVMGVLGWTLLHFVWQGALLALLLWCGLALMEHASARTRYAVCCLAMALMAALPLATFVRLGGFERGGAGMTVVAPWVVYVDALGGDAAHVPLSQRALEMLQASAPWLPWLWMAGVVVCAGRLGMGLFVAQRLRLRHVTAVEGEVAATFARVARRVGVRRVVRLLESGRVEAPTVVGWLKPVVLLPVCCFSGLSTEQMEALLAHELAHIRRHDYLVSVLQSVLEALLFYHPAVWWVSREVRRERECCCDEIAAEVAGDRLVYARALSWLEEQRLVGPTVGLGANGGVLHMRIRRVLGYRAGSVASQMGAVAVLGVVVASAAAMLVREAKAEKTDGSGVVARAFSEKVNAEVAGGAPFSKTPDVRARSTGSVRPVSTPRPVVARTELASRSANPVRSGAAQAGAGELDGVIVDPTGAVMPRVTVSLANVQTGERKTQQTDESGRYAFSVPAGRYTVGATAIGFTMAVANNVEVTPADPVHMTLKLQVGAASEYVKVSGSAAAGAAPAQAPTSNPPIRVSAAVAAGSILSKVQPVYPTEAKQKGIQGTVTLHALISKTGDVENVVAESGPDELQGAAIEAVKQWKYRPYLLNGNPVAVDTTIRVNFSLSDTGRAAESEPGASRQPGRPLRVSGGVMAGQAIVQVPPVYPEDAKSARVQGTVVLHAVVSKEGDILDLQVVSGPQELTQSAIDAVKQWKYNSYLLNGEPIEVETTINVNYSLAE